MEAFPGFVDLQVNGFLGVNFSDPTLTAEEVREAARALLAQGTAAFMPTVITSPLETYERNLPLIAEVAASNEFRGRILGLHLEGPFISAEPGAVGAHDPASVQAPSVALLEQLLEWGQGVVRLLTVAAEMPGAAALAEAARAHGVTVSIGHSLFDPEDLARMAEAGAVGLTHLGNGLPNMLPRHRNPIWAGLADDDYTALIITDGHHLPRPVIKTMARAKGADRLIVVSDASPVAGLPAGTYDVLGNRAILEPSGRLYNPVKQCLVGSTATMMTCMNVLASLELFDPPTLRRIGLEQPLAFIGLVPEDIRADDVRSNATVSYDAAEGVFRLGAAS